ncbi:hypothetical protein BN871_CR_00450 [Paenibacillus sp. P22]|nr:hypothetical protein BN871_CR_00450 [Paenibacillus sp. P22]
MAVGRGPLQLPAGGVVAEMVHVDLILPRAVALGQEQLAVLRLHAADRQSRHQRFGLLLAEDQRHRVGLAAFQDVKIRQQRMAIGILRSERIQVSRAQGYGCHTDRLGVRLNDSVAVKAVLVKRYQLLGPNLRLPHRLKAPFPLMIVLLSETARGSKLLLRHRAGRPDDELSFRVLHIRSRSRAILGWHGCLPIGRRGRKSAASGADSRGIRIAVHGRRRCRDDCCPPFRRSSAASSQKQGAHGEGYDESAKLHLNLLLEAFTAVNDASSIIKVAQQPAPPDEPQTYRAAASSPSRHASSILAKASPPCSRSPLTLTASLKPQPIQKRRAPQFLRSTAALTV